MSKTLSTEMTVDQLRRALAERNRQAMPSERLEPDEAEGMAQSKLLEQANGRLETINANLEQFRGELHQLAQTMQDSGESQRHVQRGLERSLRRHARTSTLLTFLLVVACAALIRVAWVQGQEDGRSLASMFGLASFSEWDLPWDTTPAVPAGVSTPSAPAATASAPPRALSLAPAKLVAPAQPAPVRRSVSIVSPYHLPAGMDTNVSWSKPAAPTVAPQAPAASAPATDITPSAAGAPVQTPKPQSETLTPSIEPITSAVETPKPAAAAKPTIVLIRSTVEPVKPTAAVAVPTLIEPVTPAAIIGPLHGPALPPATYGPALPPQGLPLHLIPKPAAAQHGQEASPSEASAKPTTAVTMAMPALVTPMPTAAASPSAGTNESPKGQAYISIWRSDI